MAQENIDAIAANISHSEIEMVITIEIIDDDLLGT